MKAKITLVHDATSAMARQRSYWDALMSPDAPADIIGYDRRKLKFPIGILETRFEPSEQYAGLQLADVLAGVVRTCMTKKMVPEDDRDPYVRELWSILHGWDIAKPIWPQAKFTPEELGTIGPKSTDWMEYMGRVFPKRDETSNQ